MLCEKPLAVDAAAALRVVEAEQRGGARHGRLHAPLRPGLRGPEGAAGRGRSARRVLVHCAHRNPSVHDVLRQRDDHHRHRRPRGRHHALAARPGDRARAGDDAAPVISRARGPARPAARDLRDRGRPARHRRGVRERRLRLRHPLRGRGRGGHGRAAASRSSQNFQQRFATAYQHELERWVAGEPGATAWDGYAAAAVCEAAVESLETGAPVDVSLDRRGATSAAR